MKKPVGPAKTRTREHFLADLAVNHVKRQAFRCSYSVERIHHDYGLDLVLFTYSSNGEIEGGRVLIQVKATDNLAILEDGEIIAFPLAREDLRSWLREPDPVILVLYDGRRDRAYWLYVQANFESVRPLDLYTTPGKLTVHIPVANRLNRRAVRRFAQFRDNVLAQTAGRIRHHG